MGARSVLRWKRTALLAVGASACVGLPPAAPSGDSGSSGGPGTTGMPAVASTTASDEGSSSGGMGSGDGATSTTGSEGSSGSEGGSSTGEGAIATLDVLRIELPCMSGECQFNQTEVCAMDASVTDQSIMMGEAGLSYDVTLRVRGVVEMSSFANGVPDGPVYVGGEVDSYWLPYGLSVSDPPQTYWLNALGDGDLFTHAVDYSYTVPIADGAQVRLMVGPDGDGCSLFNHDAMDVPIVVPGIPPAPQAFDGQFLQVDVESVALAR